MSEHSDDEEIEIVTDKGEGEVLPAEEADASPNKPDSEGNPDAEKFKNEYLYLRAEFENYKKNAIKDRSQLIKYGNERLILQLLEVIDNFERALEVDLNSDTMESYEKGMQMIHAELLSSLSKFGVSTIDPKGQPFDPQEHDALSSEPTSEMDAGYVFRVFKKAYRLHDKLIRPAQVVVASETLGDSATENNN